MNQLVYVANHNKTFETHVQVSSSYGKSQNLAIYQGTN